jgi:hypothetical protein
MKFTRNNATACSECTAEIVLFRPLCLSAAAARRIRVDIDGQPVALLRLGATARVPLQPGPHLLRFRCLP